ncbi:glycosyltransferase [Pseudoalteromonas sp.]|uniref:glycosyltransferase n=1 Tax=Pseudoalteromonas sp. TaxID=53249 RepID=UPI0035150BFB
MSGREKYNFLVDLREEQRTGLFYSVLYRIAPFKKNSKVFNVSYYDSYTIKLFKSLLGLAVYRKKNFFSYEGIGFEPLNLRKGVIYYLLESLGFSGLVYKLNAKKVKSKFRGKVISAHWGLTAGILSTYIARELKVKNIITFHGSDIHSIPKDRRNMTAQTLKAMEMATLNIFVSVALRDKALELGFSGGNSKVVHNGIPILENIETNPAVDILKKSKLSEGKRIIAFVGNLNKVKNVSILPYVEYHLSKLTEDYFFVFAGDGEFFELLANEMNHKIMLGYLEQGSIDSLLRSADILILPSLNEGLPLIIAEALAVGTKVVASNAGGINEILPDEFIVPLGAGFEERFAKKIYDVLNSDFCPELNEKFTLNYMQNKDVLTVESLL